MRPARRVVSDWKAQRLKYLEVEVDLLKKLKKTKKLPFKAPKKGCLVFFFWGGRTRKWAGVPGGGV